MEGAAVPEPAPRKLALLIGINVYPKLAPRYRLNGCLNDVDAMALTLREHFGFSEADMTLLRDAQATRDGILAALDALVNRAEQDDVVVIHYSGHGSQITDREGDEADGKDETIVPYDSGRGRQPNRDITDDEIYVRLRRLTAKTPSVTLIFDCCHSGTITRDAFGEAARWVEPDLRPVEELPPSPIDEQMRAEIGPAFRDRGPSGWLPLGHRYVLLAGCRDEERAFEYRVPAPDGAPLVKHGALTYFLVQELMKAGPGTTYRDLFERASALVTAANGRQHPQLEGARDRELFGLRDLPSMPFVPVRARTGAEVTLGAGAAHGLIPGARWAAYRQGSRVAAEGARLGLLEITAVRATSATATVTEEAVSGSIAAGSRAVEVSRAPVEPPLLVEIQVPMVYAEAGQRLADLVAASPLLGLATPGAPAQVRAYAIGPRVSAGPDDPVPQLGQVTAPLWAVVQDGELVMPTHPLAESVVVRDNLEREARFRRILGLTNPDMQSALRGKIGFVLLRQLDDSTWAPAEPDLASGQVVFTEGERCAFRITNGHGAAVFVSVLDLGLSHAISLLHPIEGSAERLVGGLSLDVGIRPGTEIELYLPERFPYLPDLDPRAPVAGLETFKLIATTAEADFRPLLQEGFRGPVTQAHGGGAYAMLAGALGGGGLRSGDQRLGAVPGDDWTTVERSFVLRQRST